MALPYISSNQVIWAAVHSLAEEQKAIAGDSNPRDDVKKVQQALNKVMGTSLLVDGLFGGATQSVYDRFRSEKLRYTGSDATGRPGVGSLTELGKRANMFQVRPGSTPSLPGESTSGGSTSSGSATAANYETQPEPSQDMTRLYWGGRIVNKRTAVLLNRAESILGGQYDLKLTQGSYNTGVAASAGTHDGGGVVDISVGAYTTSQRLAIVQGLRKAGFAAWLRTPAEGFSYHIHACAIGDRQMAWLAKSQVQSYFNGRSGLTSNRQVTDALHWPNWADAYNR